MAEPKKETVRIVLPARRDGSPVASSPRETAMINLPPKPVPVPGAPSVGLKPPTSMPGVPSVPKPPSMPAIPKPPSAPGSVVPPVPTMPPVMPGTAKIPAASVPPMVPKPPVPPSTVTPPSVPASTAPKPPVAPAAPVVPIKPVAPAPLQAEAKKETAKVPASTPGAKVLPQATVQFQKKPEASTPKSVSTTAAITVAAPSTESSASGDLSPVLGIAALVIALLSLGVQVWMMIG